MSTDPATGAGRREVGGPSAAEEGLCRFRVDLWPFLFSVDRCCPYLESYNGSGGAKVLTGHAQRLLLNRLGWPARYIRKMIRMRYVIRLCGLVGAGALAIAGCGGMHAGAHTAKPAVTVNSCQSQVQAWAQHGGGLAQLTALSADEGKISSDNRAVVVALTGNADPSAALATLTADASQLGADSQTALANQPPACVSGEAVPYRTAMAEYSQASQDTLTFASQISSGDYAGADATVKAATSAENKGNANLGRATAAITSLNATGG